MRNQRNKDELTEAVFYRVYLSHYAHGEDPTISMMIEDPTSIEDDPIAKQKIQAHFASMVPRLGEILKRPQEVLSWDLDSRAFLGFGPYFCIIETSVIEAHGVAHAIRYYVQMKCPWTGNSLLQIYLVPMDFDAVVTKKSIIFELPEEQVLVVRREQVLYVGQSGAALWS